MLKLSIFTSLMSTLKMEGFPMELCGTEDVEVAGSHPSQLYHWESLVHVDLLLYQFFPCYVHVLFQ